MRADWTVAHSVEITVVTKAAQWAGVMVASMAASKAATTVAMTAFAMDLRLVAPKGVGSVVMKDVQTVAMKATKALTTAVMTAVMMDTQKADLSEQRVSLWGIDLVHRWGVLMVALTVVWTVVTKGSWA